MTRHAGVEMEEEVVVEEMAEEDAEVETAEVVEVVKLL